MIPPPLVYATILSSSRQQGVSTATSTSPSRNFPERWLFSSDLRPTLLFLTSLSTRFRDPSWRNDRHRGRNTKVRGIRSVFAAATNRRDTFVSGYLREYHIETHTEIESGNCSSCLACRARSGSGRRCPSNFPRSRDPSLLAALLHSVTYAEFSTEASWKEGKMYKVVKSLSGLREGRVTLKLATLGLRTTDRRNHRDFGIRRDPSLNFHYLISLLSLITQIPF